VWPYKKRPSRTAFSGRKSHRDVQLPMHNGIIAEAFKTRKHVEVQRPDHRIVAEYQSLASVEVFTILSPRCVSMHVTFCPPFSADCAILRIRWSGLVFVSFHISVVAHQVFVVAHQPWVAQRR